MLKKPVFNGHNTQQFVVLKIISIFIIDMQAFYPTKKHPKKIIMELKVLSEGIEKIGWKE